MSEFSSFIDTNSKVRNKEGANKLEYHFRRAFHINGMKRQSYVNHMSFRRMSARRVILHLIDITRDDMTKFNTRTFKSLGYTKMKINFFNNLVLRKCNNNFTRFKFKSRFVDTESNNKPTMESISQYKDKEEERSW